MPSQELENAETLISRPPSPPEEEMPSISLEDPEVTISGIPTQGNEATLALDEVVRASTDVEDTSDESKDDNPPGTTARRGR